MKFSMWRGAVGRVPEITPEELHRWLEEGRPLQLVDARSGLEYRQGTIPGAIHVPLSEQPQELERIPAGSQSPVVFLCLSGHRSRPGTRLMRARGREAYSLKGGLLAWRRAGYSLHIPLLK